MKTCLVFFCALLISSALSQGCTNKPKQIGASCVSSTECASLNCANTRCAAVPVVAVDQDCDADYRAYNPIILFGPFLLSRRNRVCDAGLECIGYSNVIVRETLGKCNRMPRIGESCVPGGVNCIGSFCPNNTRTCTRYRNNANGADCNSTPDCQQGLQCLNNKCAPVSKAGESCRDDQSCDTGLACSNVDKKCYILAKQGETCNINTRCVENLYCDTPSAKCATYNSKAEGATCAQSVECQSGLICFGTKCTRSTANCTFGGCPNLGQICECPGSCVGSTQNFNTLQSLSMEVIRGNRNLGWLYCQTLRLAPADYIDPTIINLICTGSASAIKYSVLLLVGIALLFLGVAY